MGTVREPRQEEEVRRARHIVAVANYTTMKFLVFSTVTFCLLAGCTSVSGTQQAVPSLVTSVATDGSTASMQTQGPAELVNLSYSDGSITVFAVQNGRAKVSTRFTPGHGRAQGLAVDKSGRIYTTISSSSSNPCLACIEIFTPAGKMVQRVEAPILPSAPGPPSLTDISVDAHENVYVKVGGLGQAVNGLGFEKQAEPPSSEMVANAMRPYVETCIEAFGTRRSMFESNFPPDKEGFSYPVYWNACKRLTKGASGTERADLFAGTAARFYRLNGIG